jgi:hypothetical protein
MNTLKLKLPENTEICISHENGFRVVEIKAEKVDIQVDDLLELDEKKKEFEHGAYYKVSHIDDGTSNIAYYNKSRDLFRVIGSNEDFEESDFYDISPKLKL